MAPVKSTAIVLRRHRLGETSCIIVCYTKEYGKVRLVAKGVRKGGGRLGAALEPFVVSGVVFYLRRGLSLVSQAEPLREFRQIRRDVVRQAYAAVALELVERLVADGAPDPGLFDLVCNALVGFDQARPEEMDGLIWSFELELAERLGYAPELDRCASCGREAGAGARFSIDAGGLVCAACERAPSDLGSDVVGVLRHIRNREPLRELREIPEPLGDEVSGALLGLLERHSGHQLRLRSQAVLESLKRAGRSGGPGRPNGKEEN